MAHRYISFAGRKLVAFVVAVLAMCVVAFGAYGLVGVEAFDTSFATNIVITVCSGIGTLYATFVGGNYGEHVAKQKYGNGKPNAEGTVSGSPTAPELRDDPET